MPLGLIRALIKRAQQEISEVTPLDLEALRDDVEEERSLILTLYKSDERDQLTRDRRLTDRITRVLLQE